MLSLLNIGVLGILIIILIFSSYKLVFGEKSESGSTPTAKEWIKILNLTPRQNVNIGKELLISGESSDSPFKNCSISIIVNYVKPYQNAVANGTGGSDDFSHWKFMLRNDYSQLNTGQNKITAISIS